MDLERKNRTKLWFVRRIGLLLVALSFAVLGFIFYPVIFSELKYLLYPPVVDKELVLERATDSKFIVAADKQFALVIPKIGVNVKVIKDVDPFDSKIYQKALAQGIAHARGSSLPGEGKSTFLFAHSSDSFINANRYNSVFYLLSKLEQDDIFYVVFEEKIYKYEVVTKEAVEPELINLMNPAFGRNTVVLMTCWPPGTTLSRLIVVGQLSEQ
ncbi:MAG: sortase [Patescibacteria group bacterium]|jgi:sortase A